MTQRMELHLDFGTMVNRVAKQFEREHDFEVGNDAKRLLVDSARPHQEHVEQALRDETVSLEFLEQTLLTVLVNAMLYARTHRQTSIDKRAVEEAIKKQCPYLFWC